MTLKAKSGKSLGISVVISSVEARSIPECLLNSILDQSRSPLEVVICVDHLGPVGQARLLDLKNKARFPVHIHRNGTKLGASGSTLKAMGLCKGDIIVCCDRWDLWLPEKLAAIERAFLENPNTGLVLFNASLVDRDLEPLGPTIWDEAHFDRQALFRFTRDPLGSILKHHICRSPCMAFRATHLRWIFPIPMGWTHHGWIGLMLCAMTPVTLITRSLSLRQLDGRPKPQRFKEPFLKLDGLGGKWERRLHCWEMAVDRLECLAPMDGENAGADKIREFIKHYQVRASLHSALLRRLKQMIPELVSGRYHRFSFGWTCMIQDLLASHAKTPA